MPKQVNEFGNMEKDDDDDDDEEKFLAWIFMGAPGPGANMHVSCFHVNQCDASVCMTALLLLLCVCVFISLITV